MPLKLVFSFFFFFPYLIVAQTEDASQVLQKLEQFELTDAAAVSTYRSLHSKHKAALTVEQNLELIQRGVDASKRFGNDSMLIQFIADRSTVLIFNLRKYEQALKELKDLETKIETTSSHQTLAYYHFLLGTAYDCVGHSSKAINAYLKAIDFYELAQNFKDLPAPLFNISFVYTHIGDHDNAKKYIYEIFPICKKMEEKDGLSMKMTAHYYLCHVFANQENQDSASYHNQKALAIAAQIDTIDDVSIKEYCHRVYLAGIQFFAMQGELEKADELIRKVESYKTENGFLYFMALARYNVERGAYKEAKDMIQQLPEIEDDLANSLYVSELKSDYYEAIGNLSEALREKKKELEITKKLTNQQRLQYAAFANVEYETVKKEEEIKNLQQSEAFEKKKAELSLFIILLLIALLLLSVFAYQKIKNQAKELQTIYKQRSKLFTNVAHELRTPLSLISGPIQQIIQHANLKKEDENLLHLAKKSSEDLIRISQQILDLTKSEYSAIQSNLVKFDWNNFLHHHLPVHEIQAESRGLAFEKNIPEGVYWVQTDMEKLKVILNNLFQNALKFSEEQGKITFRTSQNQDQVSFSIQDTGTGIDKKDAPHIFKRYYQSGHDLGGFGIGLAVCQEYIELMGGSISMESQPGKGTTFSVSFPKIISTDQRVKTQLFSPKPLVETSQETVMTSDELSTKLLIIEDNEGLRTFLASTLSAEYDVYFANNGKEGLVQLDTIQPNLVITDWMMPVMDGLQFIEQLRQHEQWYDLPVLMLTARNFPLDKLKALRKGVNDYLLKPFKVDVLKVHIEHLLDLSENRKIQLELAPTPESSAAAHESIKNPKDLEWIRTVEKLVYDHLEDFDLNIGYLAESVNLSTSHFSRKIKAITGMSPIQFINEIRFWEARKLLEEKQETSVKAVVYSVGFKSVKNFSRKFKGRFGVYPKDLLG